MPGSGTKVCNQAMGRLRGGKCTTKSPFDMVRSTLLQRLAISKTLRYDYYLQSELAYTCGVASCP